MRYKHWILAGIRGKRAVKMKYELKSRNITAAQKRAPDFHKSDTLAQTNQMKMTAFFFFFSMAQKT